MSGAGNEPTPSIADLLALYRRTHYEVTLPDGARHVLRVGRPLPPEVAAWIGERGDAAYLSACNPASQPLSDDANAARMEALRAALRGRPHRFVEGRGSVPGDAWSEASVLVAGLALTDVDALARTFGQNAVLTVRAFAPPRLRVYPLAWCTLAGDAAADVDWAP